MIRRAPASAAFWNKESQVVNPCYIRFAIVKRLRFEQVQLAHRHLAAVEPQNSENRAHPFLEFLLPDDDFSIREATEQQRTSTSRHSDTCPKGASWTAVIRLIARTRAT
jgi:hypothetical protein